MSCEAVEPEPVRGAPAPALPGLEDPAVERQVSAGPLRRLFRCTNCGASAVGYRRTGGLHHPAICACAARVGGRDAGVRCVVNLSPTPSCPSEVIAREV